VWIEDQWQRVLHHRCHHRSDERRQASTLA
jgi:hypothetical protein